MREHRILPRITGMTFLALVLTAPALFAQEVETYPDWIAERFCAGWSNLQACRAGLTVDQLADGGGEGAFPQLATCDYDHPSQALDYSDACFFTWRANAFALVTKFGVQNGASMAITEVSADSEWGKAGDILINGAAAREVPSGAEGSCFQTIETGEMFCVFAADHRAPEPAAEAPEAGAATTRGFCALRENGSLLGSGICSEEHLCATGDQTGGGTCRFDYRWAIGLHMQVAASEGRAMTVDGKIIDQTPPPGWGAGQDKCLNLPETGTEFCFALDAF